ncbi:MAG: hypothetical protein KGL34_11685 [Gammaproteobacteria bacterium]|nr:hypothetical protein [Gammaproteobacteria bacterium]
MNTDPQAPGERNAWLRRALAVSCELERLADQGDVARVPTLAAERVGLLERARTEPGGFDLEGQALLREIVERNDRAIGALEHRQRGLARDLDLLATGSRAVRAYASNAANRR